MSSRTPDLRGTVVGVAVGIVLIAICSIVVDILHDFTNYEALGVVYLPAVIAVASLFGVVAGCTTSVLSAFTFNVLFLPPRFTVTPGDTRNWILLVMFVLSAIVVAELAGRERRRSEEAHEREREAALLAGLSSALVGGATLERAQADAARVAAAAIGAGGGRIVLGRGPLPGQVALPLDVDGRTIGRLELRDAPPGIAGDKDALRVASSLAGVLALARERDALASAQVEAEALRHSDALKTALLRAVSHELRSPLTAIKATVGALLAGDLTLDRETTHALLEDVSTETDRLDRLVGDLLDLSRLQAGSISTAPDWCEVGDVVRGAVAAARGRVVDRSIELTLPADELPLVHVDAGQIERVLVNLIENAAKFSPDGEAVELDVEQEEGSIDINVSDHGPGIPSEDRERVFEPFYRGSRVRSVGGTGLGLAIARGFVEANGGTLSIVDAPHRGTRMRVRLPAEQPPRALG